MRRPPPRCPHGAVGALHPLAHAGALVCCRLLNAGIRLTHHLPLLPLPARGATCQLPHLANVPYINFSRISAAAISICCLSCCNVHRCKCLAASNLFMRGTLSSGLGQDKRNDLPRISVNKITRRRRYSISLISYPWRLGRYDTHLTRHLSSLPS